jgi:HlyD family secretion protein
MKKWLVMCVGLLLVAGCSGVASSTQEETVPAVVRDTADRITAEANVEPARWVVLRSGINAAVSEVLVETGEAVEIGQTLARLDPTDAELAIQQAEAGLASARAQFAMVKAGIRPEQIAALEAQVEAAQAALAQAAAQRDEQAAGLAEAGIIDAQAQVAAATSVHRQADKLHDDTMKCYNVTLPDGTKKDICPALGTYEETARHQMEAAYAALVAAQTQLDALQGSAGPQANAARAGMQAASAQGDAAQAQLDLAQAGSRMEEIALAESGVRQAEAALARAQAQIDRCTLEAPFDGTITALPINAGDTVAPGEPLVTLATLDRLQIRTTDLTELDAVYLTVGQPVTMTLDAMADHPLAGHVVRIDRQSVQHHGDVTYPVIIELNDAAPDWLRWGMTAEVEMGRR